jgi:hypothetical protein
MKNIPFQVIFTMSTKDKPLAWIGSSKKDLMAEAFAKEL